MLRQPHAIALAGKRGALLSHRLVLSAVVAVLGASPLASAGAQSVTGQLLDADTKIPVAGATVQLLDASNEHVKGSVKTDASGWFTFVPAAGHYFLKFSRFGYALTRDWHAVEVTPTKQSVVDGHILPDSETEVAAKTRATAAMAGYYFETRRAAHVGTLITKEEIDARKYPDLAAAIASVPDTRVVGDTVKHRWSLALGPELARTAGCFPALFLNGARLNGLDNKFAAEATAIIFETPIKAVWAIEVYGGISAIPGVYAGDDLKCGALVLWTESPA